MTKINEIWKRDHWIENKYDDVFHFSVSVVEFEFQTISFLTCDFFSRFVRNSVQTFTLTSLSPKICGFIEKRRTSVPVIKTWHYLLLKYKIIETNFVCINEDWKIPSENDSEDVLIFQNVILGESLSLRRNWYLY